MSPDCHDPTSLHSDSTHDRTASNGDLWMVEARKFDGRLHYRLPVHLVEDDGERLWVHCDADALLTHVTRGWQRRMNHASDMFFWRSAWYNVYVNRTPAGELNEFYCNVGLPPQVTGTTIMFVDLDLDVSIRPDGSVALLDADEFEEHIRDYHYPRDVQRNARLAALDIIARWRALEVPFDRLNGGG